MQLGKSKIFVSFVMNIFVLMLKLGFYVGIMGNWVILLPTILEEIILKLRNMTENL